MYVFFSFLFLFFFRGGVTHLWHYRALSLRIIYQQDFSHLYGSALCTLLNISVSSRSLNRSFDQLTPGMETDTSSSKYTAGYIMTMKTSWERTPPPKQTHSKNHTDRSVHMTVHMCTQTQRERRQAWHEVRWISVSHHSLRLAVSDPEDGGRPGAWPQDPGNQSEKSLHRDL